MLITLSALFAAVAAGQGITAAAGLGAWAARLHDDDKAPLPDGSTTDDGITIVDDRKQALSKLEMSLREERNALEREVAQIAIQRDVIASESAALAKRRATEFQRLADMFSRMQPERAATLLASLSSHEASTIINLMPGDRGADILAVLPGDKAVAIAKETLKIAAPTKP